MAAIVDLLQNVAQKIRRAPEPTLVHAYRESARKFCLESRWLRRQLDTVYTIANDAQYDLVQSGANDPLLEIIGLRVVTVNATATSSAYRINPSDPMGWNPAAQPGQPESWCYVPESQIALFPTPDAEYGLTITAEVQPQVDAEELPDDLLRKWDRALSSGALAYLYDIPGQAWTNPGLARIEAVKLQAAINNAKADQQRAYNTGTVMARIPRRF